MSKKDKKSELITETAEELLGKIGLESADVQVEEDKEGAIKISIQTEQPGLLIGAHARRLQALQLVLRMIIANKLKEWQPVLVDVNGYRQEREVKLQQMAEEAAQRALQLKREILLPPMSAYDRRVVHLALAEVSEVKTESVGEGEERRVVVKPASQK
jgi:spoIIIJ-associated protein